VLQSCWHTSSCIPYLLIHPSTSHPSWAASQKHLSTKVASSQTLPSPIKSLTSKRLPTTYYCKNKSRVPQGKQSIIHLHSQARCWLPEAVQSSAGHRNNKQGSLQLISRWLQGPSITAGSPPPPTTISCAMTGGAAPRVVSQMMRTWNLELR
jgi:hypothetical protein